MSSRAATRVGPRLWRALDNAVLWRLGLIEPAPAWPEIDSWEDSAGFWRSSRVAAPVPVVTRPERVTRRGTRIVDLEGASRGPGGHAGSRAFSGRAYLPGAVSEPRFVLLLHGYAAPVPYYEDYHARRLLRRGAGAARIDLPFHMSRRQPGHGPGGGFFSSDPLRTCAVLRQATEDAAAVVAWARREVTPQVAVLGFSLGGLVACLLAATVRLDSMVAVTPPCDLAEVVLERTPARIRRRLGLVAGGGGPWGADAGAAREALEVAMAPVTPRLLEPATPGDRITLVAADCDEIVGCLPVLDLASAWGAEVLRYPRGHVTVMAARGIGTRLHDRTLRQSAGAGAMESAV